ncbi:transcriptional regulator, TetR family [Parafrankia sp. EAN1pec]|uniref:TetR family transcriptional regulator n=1 Tax=Parafrankia sp. (strain EAN1pec) TaxID=298653 RepID=UPI000054349A|nr:transcriptional regulator, TetR family [Frankia sp. EAN1pec]
MARVRTPPISRSDVIAKALEIIDRDGLEGFSIRRLGDELGINGTSLYYHFEDKDAILHGVRMLVLREGQVGAEPLESFTWQEHLRTAVIQYREVLLRHPNTAPLMSPAALLRPLGLAHRDRVVAKLVDEGVPAEHAHAVIDSAETLAYGSALLNPHRLSPQDWVGLRPDDDTPALSQALARTTASPDELFHQQIDALLDGWTHRLCPQPDVGDREAGT